MLNKTFIVAECGINTQGKLDIAKSLVDISVEAQVDAVKFQTYFGSQKGFEKYEFTKDQWKDLFAYCELKGIKWFSTPFDLEAIGFLKYEGKDIWKISSRIALDFNFLKQIPNDAKMVIISTGMSNLQQIVQAYYSVDVEFNKIFLLHCISEYPTSYEKCKLIQSFEILCEEVDGHFGLSDHTQGIEVPIAAVALGAKIIEKHITLDRNMEGPDHKASLEPDELKQMVKCIRNVELAL